MYSDDFIKKFNDFYNEYNKVDHEKFVADNLCTKKDFIERFEEYYQKKNYMDELEHIIRNKYGF